MLLTLAISFYIVVEATFNSSTITIMHIFPYTNYVLLFPYGTPGWSYGLPLEPTMNTTSDNTTEPNTVNEKHVTQVQLYSYQLHTQNNEFAIVQYGGCLFQQYLCNIWISTDQNHLQWVENHQPQLQAALYSGLEDAVITHPEGPLSHKGPRGLQRRK